MSTRVRHHVQITTLINCHYFFEGLPIAHILPHFFVQHPQWSWKWDFVQTSALINALFSRRLPIAHITRHFSSSLPLIDTLQSCCRCVGGHRLLTPVSHVPIYTLRPTFMSNLFTISRQFEFLNFTHLFSISFHMRPFWELILPDFALDMNQISHK